MSLGWNQMNFKLSFPKFVLDFGGYIPPPPSIDISEISESNRRLKYEISLLLLNSSNIATENNYNNTVVEFISILSPKTQRNESFDAPNPLTNVTSAYKWWEEITKGRSGLIVFLLPGIVSQMIILKRASTLLLGRLAEYIQPIQVIMSVSLALKPIGPRLIQGSLMTSLFIGLLYMLHDTFEIGSMWQPLTPKPDAYALITGGSSGIGFELSKLLYSHGFNLVLISRNKGKLDEARRYLQEHCEEKHQQNKPRPKASNEENTSSNKPSTQNPTVSHSVTPTPTRSFEDYDNDFEDEDFGREEGGDNDNDLDTRNPVIVNDIQPFTYSEHISNDIKSCSYTTNDIPDDIFPSAPNGIDSNPNINTVLLEDIITIPCDLSDTYSTGYLVEKLFDMGILSKIQVLVNNAGVGLRSPFIEADSSRLLEMMDLNMKASVLLTREIASHMIQNFHDGSGRILFISSTSSYTPATNAALYSATKSFITSFSQSLRRELLPSGVLVTLACPGPVRTNFAEAADADDAFIFNAPGMAMPAAKAAQSIFKGVKQGRDLVIPGLMAKIYAHGLTKFLPQAFLASCNKVAWDPIPSWFPCTVPRKLTVVNIEPSDINNNNKNPYFEEMEFPPLDDEEIETNIIESRILTPAKIFEIGFEIQMKLKTYLDKLQISLGNKWQNFWYNPVIDYGTLLQKKKT